MNLAKQFNVKYLWQNILKSKATILTLVGLIPILNSLMLLVIANAVPNISIPSLGIISSLTIIGMYTIPIALSICLFGYVFKKNSVDFINSMPLNRKTIFVTNSLGGGLILVLMLLATALVMGLESLVLPNLIVPFNMLLDYFILWSISYLFVFSVSNIAMSISGNHTTMLIVTLVILFIIPFTHSYLTGFGSNLNNTVYLTQEGVLGSEAIQKTYEVYALKKQQTVEYTQPFNLISLLFRGQLRLFNIQSIIKMIILTIIYFFVGLYLFDKRKMEINDISFKDIRVHYLIKSLTLIPILAIAIIIVRESSLSIWAILFGFALIIAYAIIYDITTMKTVKKVKLSIIYFTLTLVVSIGLNMIAYNHKDVVNPNDIEKVALDLAELNYENGDYEKLSNTYLTNPKLVTKIKKAVNEYATNIRDYTVETRYIRTKIMLKNGDIYSIGLNLNTKDYNEVVDLLAQDEVYISEYKNIDSSKIVSIDIQNDTYIGEQKDRIMNYINTELNNMKKLSPSSSNVYDVELNIYTNHELTSYTLPLNISQKLLEEYGTASNKKIKENITSNDVISVDAYATKYTQGKNYKGEYLYSADRIYGLYGSHDFVLNYIIAHVNESVDYTKPLIKIDYHIYDYNRGEVYYSFFTNNVDDIINAANINAQYKY